MALKDGKSPIYFDAAAQTVDKKIKISSIRAVRGSADGTVLVSDTLGYPIFEAFLSATDGIYVDEIHLPANVAIYDGITITTLPTGAHVYVYYE